MDKVDIDNCKLLRREIFKVGYNGGTAHLAPSFSCVEILYALYNKNILNVNKSNYKNNDRNRFILSKGHAGLALYANLVMNGLMDKDLFYSYLQYNTKIGGEPCSIECNLMEATTGSLGHGLSIGVGMSLGLKKENIESKVYVLLGDGELEEGSNWEAVMSASAFKLDNLVCIIDNNRIQKMDSIENTLGFDNWKDKFLAFGFDVKECDGHNVDELVMCFKSFKNNGKPKVVIADTIKGKGISIMENNPIWHMKEPNKKELKLFLQELDMSEGDLVYE